MAVRCVMRDAGWGMGDGGWGMGDANAEEDGPCRRIPARTRRGQAKNLSGLAIAPYHDSQSRRIMGQRRRRMIDSLEQLKSALAGRYTFERELGRGGMATVYLARDLRHRRTVAIKVLNPELAIAPERFLRE